MQHVNCSCRWKWPHVCNNYYQSDKLFLAVTKCSAPWNSNCVTTVPLKSKLPPPRLVSRKMRLVSPKTHLISRDSPSNFKYRLMHSWNKKSCWTLNFLQVACGQCVEYTIKDGRRGQCLARSVTWTIMAARESLMSQNLWDDMGQQSIRAMLQL